ncbi:MAG: hypothetical protein Q7K28_03760 [Candidatus Wildermuthbacteria bacterium]|nr:hypothetical protein [Candidatus Wildermuthbacteria bacterium]
MLWDQDELLQGRKAKEILEDKGSISLEKAAANVLIWHKKVVEPLIKRIIKEGEARRRDRPDPLDW